PLLVIAPDQDPKCKRPAHRFDAIDTVSMFAFCSHRCREPWRGRLAHRRAGPPIVSMRGRRTSGNAGIGWTWDSMRRAMAEPKPDTSDPLEFAVEEAIALCDGDVR